MQRIRECVWQWLRRLSENRQTQPLWSSPEAETILRESIRWTESPTLTLVPNSTPSRYLYINNQVGMWNYELIVGDVASGCIKYTHHPCMSLYRMLESRLRSWWNSGLNRRTLEGYEVKKRTILCSYSTVSKLCIIILSHFIECWVC